MGGVQRLAQLIATAVRIATETRGMCERGIINGSSVVCNSGNYSYTLAVDINVENGKQVWGQVADDGTFVIVGD